MFESESLPSNQEKASLRTPTPDITFEDAANGLHLPKRKKVRRSRYKSERSLLPEHRPSASRKKAPPAPPPKKKKKQPKPGEFKFKGGKIQIEPDGFWARFRLTGMQFENEDGTSRSRILRDCSTKTPIFVRREANNVHDPNAVAVYESTGGHQIGYIPKEIAKVVAEHTDDGSFKVTKAKIEKMLGFSFEPGARIRVDFVVDQNVSEQLVRRTYDVVESIPGGAEFSFIAGLVLEWGSLTVDSVMLCFSISCSTHVLVL